MESIFSALVGVVVWFISGIWGLLISKWFWIFVVIYVFVLKPIENYFNNLQERIANIELMLEELTGKNFDIDSD